jgi:hypothetical protein
MRFAISALPTDSTLVTAAFAVVRDRMVTGSSDSSAGIGAD